MRRTLIFILFLVMLLGIGWYFLKTKPTSTHTQKKNEIQVVVPEPTVSVPEAATVDKKCSIKAKSDRMVYFPLGCGDYQDVFVDQTKGDKWFCSEEEAIKAGYQVAKSCSSQLEPIYHGDTSKKWLSLTFDADMTTRMKKQLKTGEVKSWYNKKVIEVLEKKQVPATLFLTGMWIETYPGETKRLAMNPLFELANHSYSHRAFSQPCYTLEPVERVDELNAEIEKTQKLIKTVSGVDNRYFRFPGGCFDQAALKITKEQGVETIQWDSVGGDGFNKNTQSIVTRVLGSAKNGSIIVLHLHGGPNAPKTGEALPLIIDRLRERGYTFVKLSRLLGD